MNGNVKKTVEVGQGLATPLKEFQIRLERCDAASPTPSPCKRRKEDPLDEIILNDQIIKEMYGRKDQFRLLNNLFGENSTLPSCVFLWGPPSSGKTFTLDVAIKDKPFHVIKIHCAEILCGRRAFFETLVKQLLKRDVPNLKCENLQSLYSMFYDYFEDEDRTGNEHVILVVKGAENLRGEHDDIIRFLASFQDVLQAPLCVVFISTLPLQQYMPNIMDHGIIPVYFPQYSMDELNKILIGQKSRITNSLPDSFYAFYVKMIVSMFYFACRDLRKLSRLTRSHWSKFHEMADQTQEINEMKLLKLWKTLEPQLKAQFFELNSTLSSIKSCVENSQKSCQDSAGRKMSMPLNAKYMVIASYLATHNPVSTDKRFFVKSKTGGKKSRAIVSKTETKTTARAFELIRLFAIFGYVQGYLDDQAVNRNRNISLMTLVTTLCQNKLLQHIGEDSFGHQKYRCLLDYDTVLEISKSVNFELNNYLYRLI